MLMNDINRNMGWSFIVVAVVTVLVVVALIIYATLT